MVRGVETAGPGVLRVPGGNGSAPDEQPPLEELKASLRRLLATVLDRAFGIALERVEDLAGWLDEVAARGGIRMNALLGGARAALGGRNPVWGAIVGGFRAMSPAARVALIAALVLALLLLPVTVVLLLLFLIIAAVVAAVRASSR
ncbi:hypothetical protein [Pseudonocardia adelaidensis]